MPDAQPAPMGGPLPRGHLLALNRSFRRTLEAENKSSRTVEAYTDAVRFLALYCEAHGKPLLARQLRREHIQDFIADQLARWKPATAHNRYRSLHAFFKWAVAEGDLQTSPAPDRSGLLTLHASSIWTDPEGSRRIVWMIKQLPCGRCPPAPGDPFGTDRDQHQPVSPRAAGPCVLSTPRRTPSTAAGSSSRAPRTTSR
jgi:hypothetical protein